MHLGTPQGIAAGCPMPHSQHASEQVHHQEADLDAWLGDRAAEDSPMLLEISKEFSRLRPEIKQFIGRYLDRRIRHRVDTSDVAQSAFLDVQYRLARYLKERPMEVRSWLFFVSKMKTLELNQHHLGAQKRNVCREDHQQDVFDLRRDDTSPSMMASRKETNSRLHDAINMLPERYRQVIELRHLKNYSNSEASELMGISQKAASKIYVRALQTLQASLSTLAEN